MLPLSRAGWLRCAQQSWICTLSVIIQHDRRLGRDFMRFVDATRQSHSAQFHHADLHGAACSILPRREHKHSTMGGFCSALLAPWWSCARVSRSSVNSVRYDPCRQGAPIRSSPFRSMGPYYGCRFPCCRHSLLANPSLAHLAWLPNRQGCCDPHLYAGSYLQLIRTWLCLLCRSARTIHLDRGRHDCRRNDIHCCERTRPQHHAQRRGLRCRHLLRKLSCPTAGGEFRLRQ